MHQHSLQYLCNSLAWISIQVPACNHITAQHIYMLRHTSVTGIQQKQQTSPVQCRHWKCTSYSCMHVELKVGILTERHEVLNICIHCGTFLLLYNDMNGSNRGIRCSSISIHTKVFTINWSFSMAVKHGPRHEMEDKIVAFDNIWLRRNLRILYTFLTLPMLLFDSEPHLH